MSLKEVELRANNSLMMYGLKQDPGELLLAKNYSLLTIKNPYIYFVFYRF